MRWTGKTQAQKDDYLSNWHIRFAWFPTQMLGGMWVWLEPIYAKRSLGMRYGDHGNMYNWTYKPFENG